MGRMWVMLGHGHGNGHRDVVVLLADVLHNVLALASERCLSHNSGERERERNVMENLRLNVNL